MPGTSRSHEKITSEALSYLRGDLMLLVEQILPEQFGGNPSDYQLVEIEDKGMPFIEIIVSPRVGARRGDGSHTSYTSGFGRDPVSNSWLIFGATPTRFGW